MTGSQQTTTNAPGPSPLDHVTIEVRRGAGVVHLACRDLGLGAKGRSVGEAFAALEQALAERRRLEAESGLSITPKGAAHGDGSPRRRFGRWAIILAGTGLVAFQASYAISTGISRGIDRGFNAAWRDSLIASLERQVLTLADPRHQPSAEQQQRMIAVVRALKARYGPVWDEIVAERRGRQNGSP